MAMPLASARDPWARLAAALAAAALAAACAPSAPPATRATEQPPAPTLAPARPTEAPKPAAKASPAPQPAGQPTPAASPAARPAEKPAFDEKAVVDFYRGKTVRIIVGTSAGGGFDVTSRLVADRLPTYLPGSPTVIVENRPGAGGMIAANTVYATEPRDGSIILSFVSSLVVRQLLRDPGVQFDVGAFQWLGATDRDSSACLARSDTGIRTLQDTLNGRELVLGTGGPGNDSHDVPAVLAATLGARIKLVPGYPGVSEMQVSTQNKEIDGFCISFRGLLANVPEWLEGSQPFARIVAIMGDTTPDHPTVRGLEPAERLAKTEEDRQLMRLVNAGQRINKPFAVAPGVPAERVQALRAALARAYADPELRAKAERARIVVNPQSGEQVADFIQTLLRTPPAVVERLKAIVGP